LTNNNAANRFAYRHVTTSQSPTGCKRLAASGHVMAGKIIR